MHLINLPLDKPVNTGWRHPGRNLVPVHGIKVRLRPRQPGPQLTTVHLASTGAKLAVVACDGAFEVTVPELSDHEIVVFNFQGR